MAGTMGRARSLQMHSESRKHAGRKKNRLTYFRDEVAQLSFTRLQGQYLAFIAAYTKVNGLAPAEADMQRYFRVTAPCVHQMIVNLERLGLISRQPRKARSIQVLVPLEQLPALD
jgi:DNA-binding MarR family transcriptional regulator